MEKCVSLELKVNEVAAAVKEYMLNPKVEDSDCIGDRVIPSLTTSLKELVVWGYQNLL